jgi:hypothetical protein
MPITEYVYKYGTEAGAANTNMQVSVAGAVATVATSVAAVGTDTNFWVCVEEIGNVSQG